jgi:lycopene cyclase domain-containing protein
MFNVLYLVCLLTAIGCLATLDAHYQLVLWRNPRRALMLIIAGVVLFLVWDICGIHLHIFQVGSGQFLTGIRLAPQLPIEEPVFLILLMYQTIILWEGFRRYYER